MKKEEERFTRIINTSLSLLFSLDEEQGMQVEFLESFSSVKEGFLSIKNRY